MSLLVDGIGQWNTAPSSRSQPVCVSRPGRGSRSPGSGNATPSVRAIGVKGWHPDATGRRNDERTLLWE